MSGYAEGLPETQLPAGALFLQKPFSFSASWNRSTLFNLETEATVDAARGSGTRFRPSPH
jgi:hypothetical protein